MLSRVNERVQSDPTDPETDRILSISAIVAACWLVAAAWIVGSDDQAEHLAAIDQALDRAATHRSADAW